MQFKEWCNYFQKILTPSCQFVNYIYRYNIFNNIQRKKCNQIKYKAIAWVQSGRKSFLLETGNSVFKNSKITQINGTWVDSNHSRSKIYSINILAAEWPLIVKYTFHYGPYELNEGKDSRHLNWHKRKHLKGLLAVNIHYG